MGNAFQDQLFKAGLVDKNKLNKAKHEKHTKIKQQRNTKAGVIDESKLEAQKALAEKAERDRELNQKREEKAKIKAIAAQIKQLIQMNRLPKDNNGIAYNFEDQKKIKRIFVNQKIHDQISQGNLVIVKLEKNYEVVPRVVAEKIEIRDEKYLIVCNDQQENDDIDDEYKDYKIPDDLMW